MRAELASQGSGLWAYCIPRKVKLSPSEASSESSRGSLGILCTPKLCSILHWLIGSLNTSMGHTVTHMRLAPSVLEKLARGTEVPANLNAQVTDIALRPPDPVVRWYITEECWVYVSLEITSARCSGRPTPKKAYCEGRIGERNFSLSAHTS